MKNYNLLLLGALVAATFACKDEDNNVTPAPSGNNELSGTITQDLTLDASKTYLLKGNVYVQAPAKLTIPAGTVIKGDKATKGSLIIERGAQIMAQGTATSPIVFTSNEPEGARGPGDWGGVIILGKAPVNLPSPTIEGGVDRIYGGTEVNDNSGVFSYVRIEYPGIAYQPNNEINGLTMGGVGAGTTIDHVQVSHSGDDAFEWFGGTVNCKYLVAYKPVDDMFDTDNGYSGKVQFVMGVSDPNRADQSKSNGFESDNDVSSSGNLPLTSAVFSNVSLYGPKATAATTADGNFGRGLHLRRNTGISVHNALIAGWPTGIFVDGPGAQANVAVMNTVISGASKPTDQSGDSAVFNHRTWFLNVMTGNAIVTDNATLNISEAFNQTSPQPMPGSGSSLLTGGSAPADAFFDSQATYKGAFGTSNWTSGWASFNNN